MNLINKIEFKIKDDKNRKSIDIGRNKIKLKKIIYLQSFIRGFLLRKKLKLSKNSPTLTNFDDNQLNNITNNNNISNNIDIISQSTITIKKENLFTNTLEKNLMNFNPNVSRSLEFNKEQIPDNQYLNVNLVSIHIIYYIIIFHFKIYHYYLANYRIKKST